MKITDLDLPPLCLAGDGVKKLPLVLNLLAGDVLEGLSWPLLGEAGLV